VVRGAIVYLFIYLFIYLISFKGAIVRRIESQIHPPAPAINRFNSSSCKCRTFDRIAGLKGGLADERMNGREIRSFSEKLGL
jgi:hypothetical protein